MRGDEDSSLRLVYITPEKFSMSQQMRNVMEQCNRNGRLQRIVIDEAHCVSEWGHDFRPDYKKLSNIKTLFKNVPIMALTATAKPLVRADIRNILQISKSHMFIQSFNRANLEYEVRKKEKKKSTENIVAFIKQRMGQTGIVYCLSKHRCEDLAEKLRDAHINAAPYHAGKL